MPTDALVCCLILLATVGFINIVILADMLEELKGISRAIMCVHWDIYESKFATTKNDA